MYDPDPRALLDQPPWGNAFLGQRDVALLVPLDFHTGPAASLRAACFAEQRYDGRSLTRCLSNLLAAGFQRFVVDVYWDSARSVWSLCPAQVPLLDVIVPEITPDSGSRGSRSEHVSFSGSTTEKDDEAGHEVQKRSQKVKGRQESSLSSFTPDPAPTTSTISEPSDTVSVSASTTDTPSPTDTVTPVPGTNGTQLVQIGEYMCSADVNLDLVVSTLDEYLDGTDLTTDAAVHYLILNVHAAASAEQPDGPAPQPTSLPLRGQYIKNVLDANLEDKLYTPNLLQEDQNNLNESWYNVQWDNIPAEGYYSVSRNNDDNLVTQDGWPTEVFAEFKEFYRLVAGFGAIDPQMKDYDVRAELDTIFGQNQIFDHRQTSVGRTGGVTLGCLFPTDPSGVPNSSFAYASTPILDVSSSPDPLIPIAPVANLTSCGYSTLLNHTLANTTADANPLPYLAFSRSTLWTWAPGQPANSTRPQQVGEDGDRNEDNDEVRNRNRCAVLSLEPPYPGRWRTANCTTARHVACRVHDQPYNWTLSAKKATYHKAASACPSPFQFSVPRTALENAHLTHALRTFSRSTTTRLSARQSPPPQDVYVNWNSLDVAGCWTRDVNGTCPYTPRVDQNRTRVVVVPAVAAVLVFVLAALMFFVKCAGNREETRRGKRRRDVGAYEYEGVPS